MVGPVKVVSQKGCYKPRHVTIWLFLLVKQYYSDQDMILSKYIENWTLRGCY